MRTKNPSTLLAIFRRKGGEGIKTHIIHEGNKSIYPHQMSILVADEQPLVCFKDDESNWVFLTSHRVIASKEGILLSLPYTALTAVNMALQEEHKAGAKSTLDFTRLILTDSNGEKHIILLEKGKPYNGIFQLLNFAASGASEG